MATPHQKSRSKRNLPQTSDVNVRASTAGAPSHEEVEALAYRLYEARGGAAGHDLDDWLEAERLLGKGVVDSVFALYERRTV